MPILMITFLSLFEGIINSEVKYDNLNMHCHSGILLSINVTHHLTYQDFTTRTKHQNNHVHNSISKFFRQCTYLLTFYPNYDYTTRGFYFFNCRLNYSIKCITYHKQNRVCANSFLKLASPQQNRHF